MYYVYGMVDVFLSRKYIGKYPSPMEIRHGHQGLLPVAAAVWSDPTLAIWALLPVNP